MTKALNNAPTVSAQCASARSPKVGKAMIVSKSAQAPMIDINERFNCNIKTNFCS